jgi:hypothetical protein
MLLGTHARLGEHSRIRVRGARRRARDRASHATRQPHGRPPFRGAARRAAAARAHGGRHRLLGRPGRAREQRRALPRPPCARCAPGAPTDALLPSRAAPAAPTQLLPPDLLQRIFAFCACELRLTPEATPRDAAAHGAEGTIAAAARAAAAPGAAAGAPCEPRSLKRSLRARRAAAASAKSAPRAVSRRTSVTSTAAAAAAAAAAEEAAEAGAFSDACSVDVHARRRSADARRAALAPPAKQQRSPAVPQPPLRAPPPHAICTLASAPCVRGFTPRGAGAHCLPASRYEDCCGGGGAERERIYAAILARSEGGCPAPPPASPSS